MRLDNYLVEEGLSESRNKAQQIIKEALVSVDGKVVKKPSFKLEKESRVEIAEHKSYVSRAAYKLLSFLDEIGLDVAGRVALDIGSSTGGFTQVLLERDVAAVYAVDVGHDQLHHSLRKDKRVQVYEGCDIRKFEPNRTFDLVVSDVAFISLHAILEDVQRVASQDIILLFKPQFEVGREAKRNKNGVVLDKKAIANSMQKFEDACLLKGWKLVQKSPSALSGKEGNLEYCYYFNNS